MSEKGSKLILKLFFIIIFVSYIVSIDFFAHTHVINDVTITHSHLHKTGQNDQPTHEHTDTQIQLIHILSVYLSFNLILFCFTFRLYKHCQVFIYAEVVTFKVRNCIDGLFKLRPPPFFVV